MNPVRVLLIAEPGMLGDGISQACTDSADLRVVERSVAPASRAADVTVLCPDGEGRARVDALCDGLPRPLLLTAEESHEELLRVVECGASGYLSVDTPLAELLDGIRLVGRGETLVPPAMLAGLLDGLVDRRRLQQEAMVRTAGLTRRERQVLCLLSHGIDTAGIARELVISRETARTHVQNVLGKLDVHSRLEAAAFVNESGILDELVRVDGGESALDA